jgi:hypothetical protein
VCHMRIRIHVCVALGTDTLVTLAPKPCILLSSDTHWYTGNSLSPNPCVSYEEEDTCVPYDEEDT